eukprot:1894021-Pyramimonas_sp.AAC.1
MLGPSWGTLGVLLDRLGRLFGCRGPLLGGLGAGPSFHIHTVRLAYPLSAVSDLTQCIETVA